MGAVPGLFAFHAIVAGDSPFQRSRRDPYPPDSGLLVEVDGKGNAVSVKIELGGRGQPVTDVDMDSPKFNSPNQQRIWATKAYHLAGYLSAAQGLARDMNASVADLKVGELTEEIAKVQGVVEATFLSTKNLSDVVARTIDKEEEKSAN